MRPTALAPLVLLAACVVGPDYMPPAAPEVSAIHEPNDMPAAHIGASG